VNNMKKAAPPSVTGLILAGGMGTRMDHRDKGLVLFAGRPLICHMIERISDQVEPLLINCNRNTPAYQQLGYPLVQDAILDFSGPLRGLHSAGPYLDTEYCFVVPCDMPRLPSNVLACLLQNIGQHAAAYAFAAGQAQPLVLLVKSTKVRHIGHYLAKGGRSVMGWLEQIGAVAVVIDSQPDAFDNLNTPGQLLPTGIAPQV
jgi:molybdenum cofactor guanylyltransferase